MLSLVPGAGLPQIGGKPATAGFFGVLKKASSLLRVILDRRRRNIMEKSLCRLFLELRADEVITAEEYQELVRLITLPHPLNCPTCWWALARVSGCQVRTLQSATTACFGR